MKNLWHLLLELGMCYLGYAQLSIANQISIRLIELEIGGPNG